MIKGVWLNDIFSATDMKKDIVGITRLGVTHDDGGRPLAFVAIEFDRGGHGGGIYHYYMTMDSPDLPKEGDTYTQVEYRSFHAAGDEVVDVVDGSDGSGETGEDLFGDEYTIFRDSSDEEAWGEYSADGGYRIISSLDEAYGW